MPVFGRVAYGFVAGFTALLISLADVRPGKFYSSPPSSLHSLVCATFKRMHEPPALAPGSEPEAPPALLSFIGNAREWALFLDFDGTLVDLAPTPEAIVVPPHLPSLLRALSSRFDGAVAVITGRSLVNLDRHLGFSPPAAGQHGAELRLQSSAVPTNPSASAPAALRQRVGELAAAWPGLVVEDKGATLAVHYRAVPEAAKYVNAALAELAQASANTLEVVMGKSVCEVRPAGINKGAALDAFLRAPTFSGRLPLMVGDDVTDEAGFAAALRAGGSAIKVGEGETCAPWRLPAPEAVYAWLSADLEERA